MHKILERCILHVTVEWSEREDWFPGKIGSMKVLNSYLKNVIITVLVAFICSNADTNIRFLIPSSHLDFCIYAASRVLVFHSCFLVVCQLMKSQKQPHTEVHIFFIHLSIQNYFNSVAFTVTIYTLGNLHSAAEDRWYKRVLWENVRHLLDHNVWFSAAIFFIYSFLNSYKV